MSEVLLGVRGLSKHFIATSGLWRKEVRVFRALDNVSFDIRAGETFGVIGESGSGKTTCVRCILRAIRPTSGEVWFASGGRKVDLAAVAEGELKALRREMQMVFQDPFASLNPRMTVGSIVEEPLVIHGIGDRKERRSRVAAMLERVGLSASQMGRYPHAMSGGQRQRVGIARALVLGPRFVVLDEAVSALDVSVQAQVLALLKELQREMGLTYLFVSHNLAVVKQVCDRVAVMYRGRIVEMGEAAEVLGRPRHAYTRVLMSAVPSVDPDRKMSPLSVADLTEGQLGEMYGVGEERMEDGR